MERLPADAALVLNGDTVNRSRKASMPEQHGHALDLLRKESLRRRIVWVRGNHDELYKLENPQKIEFCSCFSIEKKLFISHGFDFDNIMPRHRLFIILFRLFHRLRILLGAESVHVAYYAKKFRILYNLLKRHVAENAIEHARENGFGAVACGHTHCVEETTSDGIRYINTGSWTEKPLFYLSVNDNEMKLQQVEG